MLTATAIAACFAGVSTAIAIAANAADVIHRRRVKRAVADSAEDFKRRLEKAKQEQAQWINWTDRDA